MIKELLFFLIFTALTHVIVSAVRAMSGKERLGLLKTLGYSAGISAIAVLILFSIVAIF